MAVIFGGLGDCDVRTGYTACLLCKIPWVVDQSSVHSTLTSFTLTKYSMNEWKKNIKEGKKHLPTKTTVSNKKVARCGA